MKRWLVVSFGGVAYQERMPPGDEASGISDARGKHPGDEASGISDAWGKHPGDEASNLRGAWGKHLGDEASRMRGARAPPGGSTERSWAGWLLGLVPSGLLGWPTG